MKNNIKRTKIVCTLGPASATPEILERMINAGLNVARLNFSHGDHEGKRAQFEMVRAVSEKMGAHVAVLADLSGPKLRFGEIGRHELKNGDRVTLYFGKKESTLEIQFDIAGFVKPGEIIYFNDGLVEGQIESVGQGGEIEVLVKNDGWIDTKKGINLPQTNIGKNAFTEKDREDLEFAVEMGAEYIALSFVQNVEHVAKAREIIESKNSPSKIIVKVEKPEAVNKIEEIIEASDGIMVARGDLAIETSASQVPLIQQKIINLCRQKQKPVIVATQMLESMIDNPRPTRAEASDVANAVLSEVDAVMLSAESASGKYPVEAVMMMSQIIAEVEDSSEYHRYIKINFEKLSEKEKRSNSIVSAAASLSYRMSAKAIIIGSVSGRSAQHLSSFRPDIISIVATHNQFTARQMSLVWGAYSIVVSPEGDSNDFPRLVSDVAKEAGYVSEGDHVIAIWGAQIGKSGTTDSIRVLTV